jgi:hypothetical protein
MRKIILSLLLILAASVAAGSDRKSMDSRPDITADIYLDATFAPRPNVTNGKLYLSKGRLRVELGGMTDVYDAKQKRGWRMFPESKAYSDIGRKDVSFYLPQLTDGSPCPTVEVLSGCKTVAKENIEGRSATKWQLLNRHGSKVYLWTDDEQGIAVRYIIGDAIYEARNIREGAVANSMFELPSGYSALPPR